MPPSWRRGRTNTSHSTARVLGKGETFLMGGGMRNLKWMENCEAHLGSCPFTLLFTVCPWSCLKPQQSPTRSAQGEVSIDNCITFSSHGVINHFSVEMKRLLPLCRWQRSCRAKVLEYPPIPMWYLASAQAMGKLQPHQRSCRHIRANHKPDRSVYHHTSFLMCTPSILVFRVWNSNELGLAWYSEFPRTQLFSAVGWLWEPSMQGASHPILCLTSSLYQLHAGPSLTSLLMYLPRTHYLKTS